MEVTNLIKKLNKLNASYRIKDVNEYNKEIIFEINKKTYIADYTSKNNTILAYFREIGYDYSSQETLRYFYGNFNDILRSANILK